MKKLFFATALVSLIAMFASSAIASLSMYGTSGLIETPDDTILAPASVLVGAKYINDVTGFDDNLISYGGAAGVFPKLEVGVAALDSDAPGIKTRTIISGKYKILSESVERPSVVVGVVDAAEVLDKFNSDIDNPSVYVLFGKNISKTAEAISGMVSKPLRAQVGFGTGLYKGMFAGLTWTASPKLDIMLEFLANGIRQKGTANAGVRWSLYKGLSLEAGTFAFESIYAGGSFKISTF